MSVVISDRKVRKFLTTVVKRTGKITKRDKQYIGLLSAIVLKDIVKHFEDERGPAGRWAPWSESYRKRQVKRGRRQILQDTGRLRNGWKPHRVRKDRIGIIWFNPVKYAKAHDQGDPSRNLKARPFAWLSREALADIENQTLQFMIGKK